MDISTKIAEQLADKTRAEKKAKRAALKGLPKISRKRRAEQRAYERSGYRALQPKTRIGGLANTARGGGIGGLLGKLPK